MAFHLAFSKPVPCPDEWGQEEGCNLNMFIVTEVLQKLANAESYHASESFLIWRTEPSTSLSRSEHPGHPKNWAPDIHLNILQFVIPKWIPKLPKDLTADSTTAAEFDGQICLVHCEKVDIEMMVTSRSIFIDTSAMNTGRRMLTWQVVATQKFRSALPTFQTFA